MVECNFAISFIRSPSLKLFARMSIMFCQPKGLGWGWGEPSPPSHTPMPVCELQYTNKCSSLYGAKDPKRVSCK